jgi:hypothetical protein
LVDRYIIKYEDILDIDPSGDKFAEYPHVFVIFGGWQKLRQKFKGLLRASSSIYAQGIRAEPEKRVKIFPDEFPSPEVEGTTEADLLRRKPLEDSETDD